MMARIVVSEFVTLDGVMQSPGHPDEDSSGGFDQGGWQPAYFDQTFSRLMMETFGQAGGLLLGRRTYEIFAAFWPNQPADDPVAGALNAMLKHVVSTTLSEPLAWANSTVIRADVANAISRLREQPGQDLLVLGSGELVQTLIAHDLVDAFQLMIHPLVLGQGKRLFREGMPSIRLRQTGSEVSTTGVVIVSFEPVRSGAPLVAV
jgi:dihydrofolate reductase